MALYETVFIGRQDLSETQVKAITDDISTYITSQKGTVSKTENWGLRVLAYRINKNRKGHYVLVEYEMDTQAVAELERQLRLNEDVLRYITIKLESFATEASAILRNTGSDDRYEGREGRDGGRREGGFRGSRKPLVQQEAA